MSRSQKFEVSKDHFLQLNNREFIWLILLFPPKLTKQFKTQNIRRRLKTVFIIVEQFEPIYRISIYRISSTIFTVFLQQIKYVSSYIRYEVHIVENK